MPSGSPVGNAVIVIGNSVAEITKLAGLVERFGADHAIPQKAIVDLNICLDELVSNTIAYGYADAALHEIAIELSLEGGLLRTVIRDDAAPFDPREPAAPAPADAQSPRIGGLGLQFVKALTDDIAYTRDGTNNVVTLTKKL